MFSHSVNVVLDNENSYAYKNRALYYLEINESEKALDDLKKAKKLARVYFLKHKLNTIKNKLIKSKQKIKLKFERQKLKIEELELKIERIFKDWSFFFSNFAEALRLKTLKSAFAPSTIIGFCKPIKA